MQQHLVKGFSDPVQQAQQVFRQTLNAFSEPGTQQSVTAEAVFPGLYPSTTALLLTLLDQDTTVWLPEALNQPALVQNLTFHCGCPVVADQAQAQFVVYDLDDFMRASVHDFAMGSDRYPDLSTTVIVQLPAAAEPVASVWRGPGIEHQRDCALPIPHAFWAKRQALIAFPCGVDFLFTSEQAVFGLPRTTLIQSAEESVCM